MALVGLLAAAIEMAQRGREINAGRIHQLLVRQIERSADAQQFSANGPGLQIDGAGQHHFLNEVLEQQHVRIQRENPLGRGHRNGLILRRRKADVFLVVVDPARALELLQDVHRAVGRRIVDNDDFQIRILLLEHRFEAAPDEAAAVISDHRHRN